MSKGIYMSKFYMVTDLVSGESSDFQRDVKINIKNKINNNDYVKVFSTEEEALQYAEMITPTNYYLGNPAVVTLDISDDVWNGLNNASENVTSKDVFFPKVETITYKYVQANQINEFISAKGDKHWHGRSDVFSLASLDVPEERTCLIQ